MSIRVVARIRPVFDEESKTQIIVRAESSKGTKPYNIIRIPNPKKEREEFSFTFNAVYDSESTQEELFANEVSPHLKSLFRGLDLTIFAYGVTGTGKTHTMRGGMKLSDRGVIPRLLSAIYRRGRKVTKDSEGETTVNVSLSYYEIYNDKVYDLFEPPEKRSLSGLPLREKGGKTEVIGLSEHECNDLKEFERLYIQANANRSTAGTKLNSQSSRSHAILQVKVSQITGDTTLVSTASAIDLAGSEDNRRTANNKERMIESASINKSLFVLSSCIDAIGRGDKRIPYRESRMTRILSLGQNHGITIMILNLSPIRSYHLDTLSSLNVSSRAKRIEVREIENEIVFTRPQEKTTTTVGVSAKRQPLRTLTNCRNTHPSSTDQKGDKPTKSFSVYTDKGRNLLRTSVILPQATSKSKLTHKRPPENTLQSRPSKAIKTNVIKEKENIEISSARIERLVEQKVQEALASHAKDQSACQAPLGFSESVQRRLEALEKKIESGEAEESRTEGLRFLLMARQHKERGEDASALKMYELAVPYFPNQEKLQRKIEGLKARIKAKRNGVSDLISNTDKIESTLNDTTVSPAQFPVTPTSSPERVWRTVNIELSSIKKDYDTDFQEELEIHKDKEDNKISHKEPQRTKNNSKLKSVSKKFTSRRLSDDTDPLALPTPRTQYLLDVINSRDVSIIQGLHGVGAKKARDMIEFFKQQNEDEGRNIRTLHELIAVPGLGKRSVERAYEGITDLLL
ncbi:Kinesin-like protein KIF22 [Golovinomyces cichoracearum]|uniref:Kinesin-like protein KIF22 n=1 Tax=Golovinomyces cichoracearum TaxID=62708 RepID=A0A420IQA3_9PEZI|nr:Kinesin-like protein KIF22 [Golovinomyces cichoracearum]